MKPKTLALIVLVLGGALLLRSLFPRTVTVSLPPRIRTVHDTISRTRWQFDSAALKRAIAKLKPDTVYLERLSVTPPETVKVAPRLIGVTGIVVAPFVGDSTIVQGFTLIPNDSGYELGRFQGQFYTTGPLRAFAFVNGRPALSFSPPPPKPCRLTCKAGHYLLGAAVGAAAWEVFR